MARQRTPPAPDPTWTAFAARQHGQPFVHEEPLYALSAEVIDAIQAQLPHFFTTEQEAFERDLARSSRHGFLLGRPIGFDHVGFGEDRTRQWRVLGAEPDTPELSVAELITFLQSLPGSGRPPGPDQAGAGPPGPAVSKAAAELAQALRDWLANLPDGPAPRLSPGGGGPAALTPRQLLQRRQEAYAGWLVLNPTYRAELAALRQACWQRVIAQGRFPCVGEYPPRRLGQPPSRRQDCNAQFLRFYQRWGLDRLLSWELPLPMGIVRGVVDELLGQVPTLDGVALLIPWPLLHGEQIDFQASLADLRREQAPAHLAGWLSAAANAEGARGQITYQRLFLLYRVYALVLWRRYAAACRGQLEALDRALASVMCRQEDLVRKLRQQLGRALRAVG
jgi:hypothetical protein